MLIKDREEKKTVPLILKLLRGYVSHHNNIFAQNFRRNSLGDLCTLLVVDVENLVLARVGVNPTIFSRE